MNVVLFTAASCFMSDASHNTIYVLRELVSEGIGYKQIVRFLFVVVFVFEHNNITFELEI